MLGKMHGAVVTAATGGKQGLDMLENHRHIDRRTSDRRVDKLTSRLLLRALAMQRAFGPETALTLLLTSGMDESLTRALLAVRSERRRRKARHDNGI